MGNNKFKLSDMIPNAWFYKLKDMAKTRTKTSSKSTNAKKKTLVTPIAEKTHPKPQPNIPRFSPTKPRDRAPDTIRFPEPPRRSSKRRSTSSSSRRRKPVFKPHSRFVSSSSTETSSSSESLFPSDVDLDEDPFLGLSSDCTCRLSSSTADIIIDLNTNRAETKRRNNNNNPFKDDVVSELDLPPILTKPINFDDTVFRATKNQCRPKTTSSQSARRSSSSSHSSPGIKLRAKANSPRLAASRKIQAHARRSGASVNGKQCLSESLAVVKSSVDPQRDFTESMVEMIVENNIRASRDLEELLACYLSLNSKEYHDVIVKAFERIWFDMAHIRL